MKIIYLVRGKNAEATDSFGPLAREQARLGYDVMIYPWLNPKQLTPLLLQEPPAVLHLAGPPRFPLHRLSALKSAHPFILVLEAPGPEAWSWPPSLAARFGRRKLESPAGPLLAGGVARSRGERLVLEKAWGLARSRILCLSPGVDAARFSFNAEARRSVRERLGILPGEALCLQVGPLYSPAPARRILAAGRSLLQNGRAVFALAGDGPPWLRKLLEDRARGLGILRRVKFLDAVSPGDLPGLYSAADIGLGLEAEPAAQAEAMACRLPLLPPAESLLYWWREPEAWSRRRPSGAGEIEPYLTRLVQEPTWRQELGERVRGIIEVEADWRVQAHRLCNWYRELASVPAAGAVRESREQLAA
jgi:glycosyltransferase involved in cell wall biosynthesis